MSAIERCWITVAAPASVEAWDARVLSSESDADVWKRAGWTVQEVVPAEQSQGAVGALRKLDALIDDDVPTGPFRVRVEEIVTDALGQIAEQSVAPAGFVITTWRDGAEIAKHSATTLEAAWLDVLTDGFPSSMSVKEAVDRLGQITAEGGTVVLPDGIVITVVANEGQSS